MKCVLIIKIDLHEGISNYYGSKTKLLNNLKHCFNKDSSEFLIIIYWLSYV